MTKSVGEPFQAGTMFAQIGDRKRGGPNVIGFVRPDPANDHGLLFAHPSRSDEWHTIDESQVDRFDLFEHRGGADGDPLVRLHLHTAETGTAIDRLVAMDRAHDTPLHAAATGGLSAKSVIAGGAQYCYYDVGLKRTVCVPI